MRFFVFLVSFFIVLISFGQEVQPFKNKQLINAQTTVIPSGFEFNIQHRFGQIALTRYNVEKQEEQAEADFEQIRAKEQKVLNDITEKYGPGTLDPNTGVFTPSDT